MKRREIDVKLILRILRYTEVKLLIFKYLLGKYTCPCSQDPFSELRFGGLGHCSNPPHIHLARNKT